MSLFLGFIRRNDFKGSEPEAIVRRNDFKGSEGDEWLGRVILDGQSGGGFSVRSAGLQTDE